MKLRKTAAVLLSTAMIIATLAGCGGGGQPKSTQAPPKETTAPAPATEAQTAAKTDETQAEPKQPKGDVTLRLWAHWGSEQRRPTIEKIIAGFNEKYADQGISAEYVYVPFNDIETKMTASITAGNTANCVITGVEDLNAKAMRNQATDITEYISEDIPGQFNERFWDMVKWNDKVYSLPFVVETHMVYYNKAMFQEAGIKAEDIKTWDDMVNACKKLDETLKGKDNYMIAFYPTLGNFGFQSVALANNGGIYDKPIDPDKPRLTDKENIEALEHMKVFADMYGKDLIQSVIASDANGAQDLFLSGKLAMIGQSSAYLATIEKYNGGNIDYGVFPYPAGPSATGDHPTTYGDGFVVTIPYGAENVPESVLLAEYVATEGAAIWYAEQKEFMACTKANENANSALVGWNEVTEMMDYTIIVQDSIYAPNAETNMQQAVDAICKDFTATDPTEVFTEAQGVIEKAIEDEKFIFGE